ncbi:MAG: hypothetical protein MJK14_11350 [Rivularia sp. ALOHA_DT_140]|nr:hypothetical protein [Rivularia sp. ALOHA_DT_140]
MIQNSDLTVAFQKYESQRFPRTSSILKQSLRSGKMGQLKHPIQVALREKLIKIIKPAIKNIFKSLHSYRA